MDRKNRRRLLTLAFGWAAPVGVGTVAGVVARLPSTVPAVEVAAVVIAMVAFIVPVLVSTILVVLDNPDMIDGLCRIIDSVRGRSEDRPRSRRRGKDPTGR